MASPVLVAAAVATRVSAGRGVIYRQRRLGLAGRPFELLKFRSMRHPEPGREAPEFDDERITRVGQWLRATSLDELPSLWNLLRGDITLVGPRPLPVHYWDRFVGDEYERFEVRPGITGLAQIERSQRDRLARAAGARRASTSARAACSATCGSCWRPSRPCSVAPASITARASRCTNSRRPTLTDPEHSASRTAHSSEFVTLQGSVGVERAVDHPLLVELGGGALARRRPTQSSSAVRSRRRAARPPRRCATGSRTGNEQAGLAVVDHLAVAADVGGDGRQAHRCGLHRAAREALAPAGGDEQVRRGVALGHVVAGAGEHHAVGGGLGRARRRRWRRSCRGRSGR